ncbi:MAG: YraN family protein [Proteobacteria bacterium]|nr:YraN family protein [Pseudomonadota bacterium]
MLNLLQRFGKKAEGIAARHLAKNGYRILEKNYRTRAGEIDLIAMDGPTIVFVEVKARRSDSYGLPKEAVSYHKQKKITMSAQYYLKETGNPDVKARFDVVSICMAGNRSSIEVVKNAFDLA